MFTLGKRKKVFFFCVIQDENQDSVKLEVRRVLALNGGLQPSPFCWASSKIFGNVLLFPAAAAVVYMSQEGDHLKERPWDRKKRSKVEFN